MTNKKNAEGLPLCNKCAVATVPGALTPRVTSASPPACAPAKLPGILPGVGTASKNASDNSIRDALFDSDVLLTPSSVSPGAGYTLDCDALLGKDAPLTTDTDAPLTTGAPLTTDTEAPPAFAPPDATPFSKHVLLTQQMAKNYNRMQVMQAEISGLKADVEHDKTETKDMEDKITTALAAEDEVTKKLNEHKAGFEDLQKQMSAARKVLEKIEEEVKLAAKKSEDLKRKREDYRGADVKLKKVDTLVLNMESERKEFLKASAEAFALSEALVAAI